MRSLRYRLLAVVLATAACGGKVLENSETEHFTNECDVIGDTWQCYQHDLCKLGLEGTCYLPCTDGECSRGFTCEREMVAYRGPEDVNQVDVDVCVRNAP